MTEIMAPAGSFESLQAALQANADSVFFGVGHLHMRARSARQFTIKDLPEIVKRCKKNNTKAYLTVNTILTQQDIDIMKKTLDAAKAAKVDAIIATDIAAIQYAREINLPVHISTQQNITNLETVKFFAQQADVLVLSRELSLAQIKTITKGIKEQHIKGPSGNLVKVELFAHGAMCVAVSGKCYMSLATYNASANKGVCLQNCRRSYKVTDEETGQELILDNKYVMSPKDLCTIGSIDKILNAGINILKIEGRGKSPEYVYTVTKAYKEAVQSVKNKTYTQKKIKNWLKELESVYNRGFWKEGYYLGKKAGEWSGKYGSHAKKEKIFLGVTENYFSKSNIGHFNIQSGTLKEGDQLLVTGPTTGLLKEKVTSLFVNDKKKNNAKKGDSITLPISKKIRKNDKLFKVVNTTG